MAVRFAPQALALSAAILLCLPAVSDAADSSELAARGKLILQENCGRCHAIEAVGDSPLKKAPPMRDIYVRFAPRELQAELSEGMVSKHKEMPQIEFSDEDVYAIMTYLYSLAVRK
jgi:mono/diheme cytochrome c family protein